MGSVGSKNTALGLSLETEVFERECNSPGKAAPNTQLDHKWPLQIPTELYFQ